MKCHTNSFEIIENNPYVIINNIFKSVLDKKKSEYFYNIYKKYIIVSNVKKKLLRYICET